MPTPINWILFAISSVSVCVFGYMLANQPDKREHVQAGLVIATGACHGGTGFFDGNHECRVKVRVGNSEQFWDVYGNVMVGETVYKECFYDEDRAMCHVVATTTPRMEYRTNL